MSGEAKGFLGKAPDLCRHQAAQLQNGATPVCCLSGTTEATPVGA